MMIQSKTGFEGSHNVGSGRVGRGGTGQTTNLLLAVWHFVLQNLGFSSFNLSCWQGALEVAFWRYSYCKCEKEKSVACENEIQKKNPTKKKR